MTDEKALEISNLIQNKCDINKYLNYYISENIKFYIYIGLDEKYMPIPLSFKHHKYFLQDELKELVISKLKKELEETDIKLKSISCE